MIVRRPVSCDGLVMAGEVLWRRWLQSFAFLRTQWSLQSAFVSLTCLSSQPNMTALWRTPTPSSARPSPTTASSGLESASRRMELYAAKYPGKYFVFDCSGGKHTIADSVTYSVPSTERLLNAKRFSRLPAKSVARQEALWQDTLREDSVRALCQERACNSGPTCHLKEAVRARNFIGSGNIQVGLFERSLRSEEHLCFWCID